MDRGRQIDNIQNTNAVYIDGFGNSGKTSVKTSNPPGGKSNFSFGWSQPEPQQPPKQQYQNKNNYYQEEKQQPVANTGKKYGYQQQQPDYSGFGQQPQNKEAHTSIKISQKPGGHSNIVFGTDDSNYDHYRK